MSTLAPKHFDSLDFVEKSKELGVDENVAKYQARQFEQAIEIAISSVKYDIKDKELATKGDVRESELRLQKEISNSKNQTIIWVVGFILASGLIQHFFK